MLHLPTHSSPTRRSSDLLAQVKQMIAQLGCRFVTQILDVHQRTVRVTKAVWTESLAAARRNASRATSSDTPSISYNTRPGWTGATQYSTLPLPEPMRTSIGFLVIDRKSTRLNSSP